MTERSVCAFNPTVRPCACEGTYGCRVSRCAVLGPRRGFAPASSARRDAALPVLQGAMRADRPARWVPSARLPITEHQTRKTLPLRERPGAGQLSPAVRSLVTKLRLRGRIRHRYRRTTGLEPVRRRTTCSWRGVRPAHPYRGDTRVRRVMTQKP